MKVTNQIKQDVQNLVQEIESQTTGEIVPVILANSDSYPAAHFRWALFLSLLFPLILYLAPIPISDPIWFLATQAGGCLLGLMLAFHPKFKRLMLTKGEMTEEVHQRAVQIFFQQGLHTTEDRDGVLVFLSLLEHRTEILSDVGIAAKVPAQAWSDILQQEIHHLKRGDIATALLSTIRATGDLLIEHFPRGSGQAHTNELDDTLKTE